MVATAMSAFMEGYSYQGACPVRRVSYQVLAMAAAHDAHARLQRAAPCHRRERHVTAGLRQEREIRETNQ